MLPSFAGIIPDRAKQDASQSKRYVCAFCDGSIFVLLTQKQGSGFSAPLLLVYHRIDLFHPKDGVGS